MPGLMDAHTHVIEGQRNWELELSYLYEDSAYLAVRGLKTAPALLNAGITTVRDVGNDANYAAVDLRKAIEQGWFTGPTILQREISEAVRRNIFYGVDLAPRNFLRENRTPMFLPVFSTGRLQTNFFVSGCRCCSAGLRTAACT